MEKEELLEKMKQAFADLCEDNPPRAFLAITVDEDMMVNFVTFGVEHEGTVDLLEHMLEYIKSKENEDEYGREEGATLH